MSKTEQSSVGETLLGILQAMLALMCSVYFIAEAAIIALIPRSFKRHSVEGQIVLITGGGSGLGRLAAIKLAKKGAKIVIWDVNPAGKSYLGF